MKTVNKDVLKAVSIVGSPVSPAIDCSQIIAMSLMVVTTGGAAPTFTAKIQVSNDPVNARNMPGGIPPAPTNWVDLPTATVSVTTNGALLIPKMDMAYGWLRVVITTGSGTGTVSANLFGLCV